MSPLVSVEQYSVSKGKRRRDDRNFLIEIFIETFCTLKMIFLEHVILHKLYSIFSIQTVIDNRNPPENSLKI